MPTDRDRSIEGVGPPRDRARYLKQTHTSNAQSLRVGVASGYCHLRSLRVHARAGEVALEEEHIGDGIVNVRVDRVKVKTTIQHVGAL